MTTAAAATRPRPGTFRGTFAPTTFVVATFGEFLGLAGWRALADGGHALLALLVLVVGFAVERGAVARWLRRIRTRGDGERPPRLGVTVALLALVTVIEIAMWYGWYRAAGYWNVEIAGLLFFVAIHSLHAQEMGAVRRQPGVRYLVSPRTAFFSLMEALGATLWLALTWGDHPYWGLLALFAGLCVEHVFQGKQLADEGI